MCVCMVLFDGLVLCLCCVVCQFGMDIGKQVYLILEGIYGELDCNVFDCMVVLFEYMLCNFVVYGLEVLEQCCVVGKLEEGEVVICLYCEGLEIVLEVVDDGVGFDCEVICCCVIDCGLLVVDVQFSEQELDNLIFVFGFFIVDQVSQLVGCGVGMDVVCNEVCQLGGLVDIQLVCG